MKKVLIFYAILVVVIVVFLLARGGNFLNFKLPGESSSATAKLGGKTYNLILAKTDSEKMKGLSGRGSLSSNTGMLFIFKDKDNYGFWMRDMKFPIDIIYINDNKVVDFVENAPAPTDGQSAATLPVYKPSQKTKLPDQLRY